MRLCTRRLKLERGRCALAALAFFVIGVAAGLEAIHLAS